MKKILLSLMMLCSITAAWAGTGTGTKDDPYKGEWDASSFISQLKTGDHLAYDCVISNGTFSVTDDKLDRMVIDGYNSWRVAFAIDESASLAMYNEYYLLNSHEVRKTQTFIVTKTESPNTGTYHIIGHYSGRYERGGDGTKENPFFGTWQASELGPKLEPGMYLAFDCVIKDGGTTVTDYRLSKVVAQNWPTWSPGNLINDPKDDSAYKQYGKDNPSDQRKKQSFLLTYVSPSAKTSTRFDITGYFTGFYTTPDANGFVYLESAEQMKIVLGRDSHANILLTNDIYMSDLGLGESGCHVLCDTFYGILDGDGHTIWAARPEVQHDGGGHYHRQYLFNNCDWVIIRNLTFKDFRVQSESVPNQAIITSKAYNNCRFANITLDHVSIFGDEDNVGAVAGWSDDCTFENITVKNSDFTTDASQSGAIVGHALYCIIKDIKVENCESTSDEGKAGGVTGRSDNCTFNGVSVQGGDIEGHDDSVGGVCGYATHTKFISCVNSAYVHANDDRVGGIVGYGEYVDFTRCDNHGHIYQPQLAPEVVDAYHYNELGGIAGHAENGKAEFCSNYGAYESIGGLHRGGIIGYAEKMTVNNCYCDLEPVGKPNDNNENNWWHQSSGGIVGYSKSCKFTNNACRRWNCLGSQDYTKDIDPDSHDNYYEYNGINDDYPSEAHIFTRLACPYEQMLSSTEFRGGLVAYRLNNSRENLAAGIKPWHQKIGDELTLDPEKPEVTLEAMKQQYWSVGAAGRPNVWSIKTAAELYYFASWANDKHYNDMYNDKSNNFMAVLENDIDMAGTEFENWIPIGTEGNPYKGIFDGQGHTIKGIKVTDDNAAGLFGYVSANAIIENVHVADSKIVSNGEEGAGGIVGQYNLGGSMWGDILIRNCSSSADVTALKHAGGIFGRFVPKTIDNEDHPYNGDYSHNDRVKIRMYNCYSYSTVTATSGGNSGLLCGYTRNTADVKNCWSVGKLLSGKEGVKPYSTDHNEFFVGYMDKANIANCYAINPSESVQYANANMSQNGVTNISGTDASSGRLAYEFNKNCGKIVLQQNIGTNPYPIPGDKGIYHTRTHKVGGSQYGTVCLPFPVKSNDKISFYSLNRKEEDEQGIKLVFTYNEDKILEGTPLLFRSAEAKDADADNSVEICFNNAGEEFTTIPRNKTLGAGFWDLWGTFEQRVFEGELAEHIYYVSGGVIRNGKKTTIAPYRAWIYGENINTLKGDGTNQAKAVRFVIEDEDGSTTSIDPAELDFFPTDRLGGESSYSIMGTKVDSSYRGIVIQNGKKYMRN